MTDKTHTTTESFDNESSQVCCSGKVALCRKLNFVGFLHFGFALLPLFVFPGTLRLIFVKSQVLPRELLGFSCRFSPRSRWVVKPELRKVVKLKSQRGREKWKSGWGWGWVQLATPCRASPPVLNAYPNAAIDSFCKVTLFADAKNMQNSVAP